MEIYCDIIDCFRIYVRMGRHFQWQRSVALYDKLQSVYRATERRQYQIRFHKKGTGKRGVRESGECLAPGKKEARPRQD